MTPTYEIEAMLQGLDMRTAGDPYWYEVMHDAVAMLLRLELERRVIDDTPRALRTSQDKGEPNNG